MQGTPSSFPSGSSIWALHNKETVPLLNLYEREQDTYPHDGYGIYCLENILLRHFDKIGYENVLLNSYRSSSSSARVDYMDHKRKESSFTSLEVGECKVGSGCSNGSEDIRKFLHPTTYNKLGEHNVSGKNNTTTLRQTRLSFKRKVSTEGCVVDSSSEPPAKRSTLCGNQGAPSPTAETLPLRTENELPYADHAKLDCTCSAGLNDPSSLEINITVFTETTLKESPCNVGNKERLSLCGSSQMSMLDTVTKAMKAPIETPLQYPPVKEAQETTYNIEASTLSRNSLPDSGDQFFSFENHASSADGYADLNGVSQNLLNASPPTVVDQLSPKSWSQEYCGLQRPSTAPEVATTVCVSGTSGIESCTQDTTRGLSGSYANQVTAVDLHNAEYNESIHMRSVQMESADPLFLLSEGRLGTTGMVAGRSHCTAKLFDCLGPVQGDANSMVNTGPSLGGFSFQRLISGDITGFEHEFEEDSDEDCGEKVGGEAEEDESDMYSTVCTPSAPPLDEGLELGVSTPDSESQHSDDMYYSQIKIAKHSPSKRSRSVDFDSEVSEFRRGVDEGASCSSPQKFHGSPCLQPKVDVDWQQTSSDSSRDLYSVDINYNSRQQVHSGSPCLHSTTEAYRPVLPWDPFPEECVSLSRQQQVHGSPCLHPISDLSRQSSTDISEDLLLCPRSHDILFRTNRVKEETAVSSIPCKKTVKEQSNCAEEGTMIDTPTTAKALLSSGLLEGFPVSYQAKGGGVLLTGVIKNGGILCNCRVCKGKILVNVSCFEKHAGSTLRHPSDNIYLENGKSLLDILKSGWHSSDGKFVNADRNASRNNIRGEFVNNISDELVNKYHNDSNSVSQSHHKHRFDSNASRVGQSLPPSQTRDMNKLLFLPGGLPDGTEVSYYIKGQRILTGTKKGHGICCNCCNEVISCSLFEAHAGWGSRRNPYNSIFLPDGQSLHKFAQSLAVKMEENFAVETSRDNDDVCAECGDGGDLVLCDACPGAYHTECLGLSSIPEGDWFCPLCEDKVEHARNARRQWGEKSTQPCGPLLSITTRKKGLERCQRVVKASKNSIGGCVICKNGDFLKTGFGAKTVLLCDQCEREFHVGCMKEKGIVDLQDLPAGEWFCGADCTRIHKVLEELVSRGPMPVCSSVCNVVLEVKQQEEGQRELKPQISEFTWQLLHGRRGDPENGKVLSEAATVFTESFDPIIDATSGRDLISLMVHSRSIRDQDFRGMYCAVLKWKQTIVSTAMIRVFGRRFAEMPLVATSTAFRGQGFFQILLLNIERLLGMLQVEHLVLPATDEAEGIWTRKFGFLKLEEEQVQQFESEVQIMMFQGSSMLLKSIPHQSSHG